MSTPEPLAPEVELLALKAIEGEVVARQKVVKALIGQDYPDGRKEAFRSPVTGAKLGTEPEAERWAPVPGLPFYEASTFGRIRSIARSYVDAMGRTQNRQQTILKPSLMAHGHLKVSLGRTQTDQTVHRLVLETFVGPAPQGMEGCHDNGDPTDNRLSNLRWDTHAENMQDAVTHGTHWAVRKTHCPRGHPLQVPNIVRHALRKGHRECLACSRAQSRVKWGRKHGLTLDRVALSHAYYAELMSRETA